VRWAWDPDKNRNNRRRHGLGFEAARLVFDDPLALSLPDPYPDGPRWRTMGVIGGVVLMVIHTWPEAEPATGEEVGRIISARKATSHERKAYEAGDF